MEQAMVGLNGLDLDIQLDWIPTARMNGPLDKC
jgi:hypothetical protein